MQFIRTLLNLFVDLIVLADVPAWTGALHNVSASARHHCAPFATGATR